MAYTCELVCIKGETTVKCMQTTAVEVREKRQVIHPKHSEGSGGSGRSVHALAEGAEV